MYSVTVRNEHTGEMRVVEVSSSFHTDAQIEALMILFQEEGWNKARALQVNDEVDS